MGIPGHIAEELLQVRQALFGRELWLWLGLFANDHLNHIALRRHSQRTSCLRNFIRDGDRDLHGMKVAGTRRKFHFLSVRLRGSDPFEKESFNFCLDNP